MSHSDITAIKAQIKKNLSARQEAIDKKDPSDLVSIGQVYGEWNMYFLGSSEALVAALGPDDPCAQLMLKAQQSNELDLDSIERRIELHGFLEETEEGSETE